MDNAVILIGFMGSGKTSTGKELSSMLTLPFYDTDEQIEKEQRRSINEIFKADGEAYFRKLEQKLIKDMLQRELKGVISVGGGLPAYTGNAAILKQIGTIVYLNAQKETLVKRLKNDTTRPLLAGGGLEQKIASLMASREQIYKETADYILDTDELTPKEAAAEILQLIKGEKNGQNR